MRFTFVAFVLSLLSLSAFASSDVSGIYKCRTIPQYQYYVTLKQISEKEVTVEVQLQKLSPFGAIERVIYGTWTKQSDTFATGTLNKLKLPRKGVWAFDKLVNTKGSFAVNPDGSIYINTPTAALVVNNEFEGIGFENLLCVK